MTASAAPRHVTIQRFVGAFIAAIDRQHPAFADVRWSQPQAELVADLAQRSRAAIHRFAVAGLQPEDPPGAGNRVTRPGERAGDVFERCLGGTWISSGQAFDFPDGIDYTVSPHPSTNTRNCDFGEWTWQLNRHWEWQLAARLFVGTGEQRYAQAVLDWCERWLAQSPPPAFDGLGPNWRTIEIGIRLAGSWATVLSALAEQFDDELWLAWLGAWTLQAPFVWQHRKHNNWLHMEMNGLLHAGIALPFMRDAARWREQALSTLLETFALQVHPDGMQYELSPGYHVVCIGNLERPVASLRAAGYPVPPALEEGIAAMYAPYRALARPDGVSWAFQDSGVLHCKNLSRLPERYRQPGDSWFIDGSGDPPRERHSVLPYAGYVVLRASWDADALCVAFDGGPYGNSHQHEDKLAIQLCARGTDLIGEAGTVDYADSPQRRYCLCTLGHSTAIVDGEGQNRRTGFDRFHIPLDQPAELRHDLQAEQPWVEASYDEGYGKTRIPVVHHRRVSLLAEDLVEVRDRFEASDGASHRVELLFHLLVPEVEVSEDGIGTRGPGGNCALHSSLADGTTVPGSVTVGGEAPDPQSEEPDLRGWASTGGPLEALPCWTVAQVFTGTLELVTRIRVFAPGTAAQITSSGS